jgi:uncharacterized SAM-binding protein YcdF (DUF218 family)
MVLLNKNEADCLIILGYRCEHDQIHPFLKERLDHAISLVSTYSFKKIIVSGGSVASKIPEAVLMRDYLIENGVTPRQILIEIESKDTIENLVNCMEIMRAEDLQSSVIISNLFHIQRMKYIARKLGMETTFSAKRDIQVIVKQFTRTMNELKAFMITYRFFNRIKNRK